MRKNYFAELRAVLLISAALLQGVSLYASTGEAVAETKGAAAGEVAQKKTTVKGVVTDDKGEPLIGVSIALKNFYGCGKSDIDLFLCRLHLADYSCGWKERDKCRT